MRPLRHILPLTLAPLTLMACALPALASPEGDEVVVATRQVKVTPEATTDTEAMPQISAASTAVSTQADVLASLETAGPRATTATQPTSWGSFDKDTTQAKPARQIHGEFGAAIGTGGYKSGYVSALIPIGETGTLGIAISQTDFGKNGYYLPNYGSGYGGYGPRGGLRGGGTSQSLSLMLDFSDDHDTTDADKDCDSVRWSPSMTDPMSGGTRRTRTCSKTTWYNY